MIAWLVLAALAAPLDQASAFAQWGSRATPEADRARAAIWLAEHELASDPGLVLIHVDPWLRREVPGEPALTRRLRALASAALVRIGDDSEAHELDPTDAPSPPVEGSLGRAGLFTVLAVGVLRRGRLAG